MALTQKDRQQVMVLAILLAVGAAGGFWFLWRDPKAEEIGRLRTEIDSLQARVDSARKDLREGTVEQLRQRIAAYEGDLGLMRRLVPTGSEVPQLIDDIASRAALRGVQIAEITPLSSEGIGLFTAQQYRFVVFGHFDQVGEFLADVASLPRIMVPHTLALSRANPTAQRTYQDTTGSLLEARFQLRTFVKPSAGGTSGGR